MHKTAILERQGEYRIIVLDDVADHEVVGDYDTKRRMILRKKYQDIKKSYEEFHASVNLAIEEDWIVVYRGDRNWDNTKE